MPRKVEITVPSNKTNELISDIKEVQGLVGLRVERGVSIKPPGDVITVEITNRSVNRLLRLLEQNGVGREVSGSITTSEPFSLISASSSGEIEQDINDVPWEEIALLIHNETNMNANMVILMAIAGAIAAVGIATNALHLVIGAMVIAPGFQPLVHIALGTIAQSTDWRDGIANTIKGYGSLIVGAGITGILLQLLGIPPLTSQPSYLPTGVLVSYWTNINPTAILITVVAGSAGGILMATRRSVLTAGVMIGLALIPAATLMSLGLVTANLDIAGKGLLRWAIEVTIVIVTSALVFTWKRIRVQRRKMLP